MPRSKQSEKKGSTTSRRTRKPKLKTPGLGIKKSGKQWWIEDNGERYGPYDNREEADEDARGIDRLYVHGNEPGFVISEDRESLLEEDDVD